MTGGLRYHGMSPLVSHLTREKFIEAIALPQLEVFEAATTFSRIEGIIPAPESAHAIRAAIIEANKAKLDGISRIILFNLSGHGHFDMSAYDAFHEGKLQDYALPEAEISGALEVIKDYPKP